MDDELIRIEGALAPSIEPAEQRALFAAGHILYARDEYERAADVFRFIVLADPLDADAWWALGACHEQLGDFEAAALQYENAFRFGEARADVGLLWTRALIRAGSTDAKEALNEVAELELDGVQSRQLSALRAELGGCDAR